MPFLSFALIFSSSPVLAQNLVDTVPDFYYLDELNGDSISIRACLFPKIEDRSSVENLLDKGLDCSVVAEVSNFDLENFLDSLLDQAKGRMDNTQSHNTLRSRIWGAVSVVGTTAFFYGAFKDSILIFMSGIAAGVSGILISSYYRSKNTQNQKAWQLQQTFSQQVRSGVVGHISDRELFLQQFTDFLNEYGRPPVSDEAAAAVVPN